MAGCKGGWVVGWLAVGVGGWGGARVGKLFIGYLWCSLLDDMATMSLVFWAAVSAYQSAEMSPKTVECPKHWILLHITA